LVRDIGLAGGLVVHDVAGIRDAHRRAQPAIILGIEGADAVGDDVDNIDALYRRGVRVVVLVHLGDNQLGTTCMPWQEYVGPVPAASSGSGPTTTGAAACAT